VPPRPVRPVAQAVRAFCRSSTCNSVPAADLTQDNHLTSVMCGLSRGSLCQQAVMSAHMVSGMDLGRDGR